MDHKLARGYVREFFRNSTRKVTAEKFDSARTGGFYYLLHIFVCMQSYGKLHTRNRGQRRQFSKKIFSFFITFQKTIPLHHEMFRLSTNIEKSNAHFVGQLYSGTAEFDPNFFGIDPYERDGYSIDILMLRCGYASMNETKFIYHSGDWIAPTLITQHAMLRFIERHGTIPPSLNEDLLATYFLCCKLYTCWNEIGLSLDQRLLFPSKNGAFIVAVQKQTAERDQASIMGDKFLFTSTNKDGELCLAIVTYYPDDWINSAQRNALSNLKASLDKIDLPPHIQMGFRSIDCLKGEDPDDHWANFGKCIEQSLAVTPTAPHLKKQKKP